MKTTLFVLFCTLTLAYQVRGHGYMLEPPNRGSLWRFNESAPINYDDMGNFCGGAGVQWSENGGKCGACGDNWADPVPRNNENGGLYGQGVVPRVYYEGSIIQTYVNITASHKGHFEFNICDLAKSNPEKDECFDEHPVALHQGAWVYNVTDALDYAHGHIIYLRLPEGLTCSRCVLRWHYRTGNSAGLCEDGTTELGCGNQETFRTCSDIAIIKKT